MDFATVKKRLPNYRSYAICFVFLWVMLTTFVVSVLAGVVKIECIGIRLDSNGNIYVGLMEEIRVFDKSGKQLRTISPKTSRGYSFAIKEDKLYVDCSSGYYVMDLNGEVLELKSYPQVSSTRKTPKTRTIKGVIYHINCSNFFYRVTVEEHGEKNVAVQIPALDLAAEIAGLVVCVSFAVFVLKLLRRLGKPYSTASK